MHKKISTTYCILATMSLLCISVQTANAGALQADLVVFGKDMGERGAIGMGALWKGLRAFNQDYYFDSFITKSSCQAGRMQVLDELQDYVMYAAADATLDLAENLIVHTYQRKKTTMQEHVNSWFKNWLTTMAVLIAYDHIELSKASRACFLFLVKTAINTYLEKKEKSKRTSIDSELDF